MTTMQRNVSAPVWTPTPVASKPMINVAWELIGPELAKKYLDKRHPKQRRLRAHRVEQYARDMIAGRWSRTSEAIAFDEFGYFVDGQHRLSGVVASGVSVWFLVSRGVSAEAMVNMGSGLVRTTSDCGMISGRGDYSASDIACSTSMMYGPRRNLFTGAKGPTRTEILDFMDKYKPAIMFSQERLKNVRGAARGVRGAVARAWLHVDHDRLSEWCAVLRSGMPVSDEVNEDSAAITFRDFMMRKSSRGGPEMEIERYNKCQTSIQYFVARRVMTRICSTNEDLYPLV